MQVACTPRRAIPGAANDQGHRAGARDFPVQNRLIRPLRCTDLLATARGMCPGQSSGSGRSVDHEAHEEHEAIRERSVRCHLVVPARGAREPRSHNRSFDSAERRIPASCSSWLLQRSPVVNALSGRTTKVTGRRPEPLISDSTRPAARVDRFVRRSATVPGCRGHGRSCGRETH